jgi:hypothetical protein
VAAERGGQRVSHPQAHCAARRTVAQSKQRRAARRRTWFAQCLVPPTLRPSLVTPGRLRSEAALACLAGVAPIPAAELTIHRFLRTRSASGRGLSARWPAPLSRSVLVCGSDAGLAGPRRRPEVTAPKPGVALPAENDSAMSPSPCRRDVGRVSCDDAVLRRCMAACGCANSVSRSLQAAVVACAFGDFDLSLLRADERGAVRCCRDAQPACRVAERCFAL